MGEDVVITPKPRSIPEDLTSNGRQNPCRAFNKPGSTPVAPKSARLEGRYDELKGNVYDCSNPRQAADEFTRTTKEIAEYTGIKFGAERKLTIKTLKKPTLPMPADPPDDVTATEKRIWERRADTYVEAETTLDSDLKKIDSLTSDSLEQSLRQSLAT